MNTEQGGYWEYAEILEKAEKVLGEYPLCDRCLGRLFAKKGIELSNEERGRAIKTFISMKLYSDYTAGRISLDYIRKLAENGGEPLTRLYRKLAGEEPKAEACYICSNRITPGYIEEVAKTVAQRLLEVDASTFLIGVILDNEVVKRNIDVSAMTKLESSESLKNELKREIGKKVSQLTGLQPDFSKPDAVAIVSIDRDFNYTVKIQVNPFLIKGVYFKKGRMISHVPWISRNGVRKYPESIQDFIRDSIAGLFDATDVKIHAAGREDVDARMLGSGRPVIIEVKEPRFRNVTMELLNYILDDQFIKVEVAGPASRKDIEAIKGTSREKKKAYRISVLTEKPIEASDLERLVKFFNNRVINQRTPSRILGRKKDRERTRRVYSVEVVQVTPVLFEALVYCDGGLYVKELVHCDNGRTSPCFSEVLGVKAYPLELDVVYVETA